MKDLEQAKNWYSQDLEQRKNWYSSVADAYNQARPRYPKELIVSCVELAQLPSEAAILEIGCGPGIATVPFAQLGFKMVCLEPSPDSCFLARQNCASYPNVEIRNSSFEEWELETKRFNAVLAATAIHWIPPEVAYPKSADALQGNGSLILLWNKEPFPPYEVYQSLNEVYQTYAPSLARYEDRKAQEEILKKLGQNLIDSGLFKDLVFEHMKSEVTYSTDKYLMLLSTLSPYIALEEQTRDSLFEGLREKIEKTYGGSLHLSYVSAFHIARKK